MKKLILALVAALALCTTVTPAQADWVLWVGSDGWVHWFWDPAFDYDDWETGKRPPRPPLPVPFWVDGVMYVMINGVLYYWTGDGFLPV